MTIRVVVNGQVVETTARPDQTLLNLVRAHGLTGAKESCGRGECGACTVLVDGVPRLSCVALAAQIDGEVTTVEGLGTLGRELGERFADHGAFQCAYCTPGHVVTTAALVQRCRDAGTTPDRETVRRALNGNLCRCTGYSQIVDAVHSAVCDLTGASGSGVEE